MRSACLRLHGKGALKLGLKNHTRQHYAAHAHDVRRFLLAVKQGCSALAQQAHKPCQRGARSFGLGVEHGFAKKSPP